MSDVRAFESFFRQAVLRDFHPGSTLLHLPAQYRHLGDGEARVVSDHDRGGVLENAVQRRDHLLLLRSVHFLSPVGVSGRSGKRRLHLAGPSSAFAGSGTGRRSKALSPWAFLRGGAAGRCWFEPIKGFRPKPVFPVSCRPFRIKRRSRSAPAISDRTTERTEVPLVSPARKRTPARNSF